MAKKPEPCPIHPRNDDEKCPACRAYRVAAREYQERLHKDGLPENAGEGEV